MSSSSSLNTIIACSETPDTVLNEQFPIYWHHKKPGVPFRSLHQFLANVQFRNQTFDALRQSLENELKSRHRIEPHQVKFAMNASRGYLMAPIGINCQMVMVAKKGQLPGKTVSSGTYSTEYSEDEVEICEGSIQYGDYVCVADDWLVTGGTNQAVARLCQKLGAKVVAFCLLGVIANAVDDDTESNTSTESKELQESEESKESKEFESLSYCTGERLLNSRFPDVSVISAFRMPLAADPDPHLTQYLQNRSDIKSLVTRDLGPLHVVKSEMGAPNPVNNWDKIVVITHPTMNSWARALHKFFPGMFELLDTKFARFPDGAPDQHIYSAEHLRYRRVLYIMSNYKDPFEAMGMPVVIPRQGVQSLTIFLPFVANSTYERVDVDGDVAYADIWWNRFSADIPPTKEGPCDVLVADIHAPPQRWSVRDQMRYNNVSCLPHFLKLLGLSLSHGSSDGLDSDFPTIIFPDIGSFKRFFKIIEKYVELFHLVVITFDKHRQGDKRWVSINSLCCRNLPDATKDPVLYQIAMRYGIIVDDLIASGGTMIEAAKSAKKDLGFQYLSAYVPHGRFPQESYKKFLGPDCPFHTIYCGDSIPEIEQSLVIAGRPFYTLPISSLFVQYFQWPAMCLNATNDFAAASVDFVVFTGPGKNGKPSVKEVALKRAVHFLFSNTLFSFKVASKNMGNKVEYLFNDPDVDSEKEQEVAQASVPSQPYGADETMLGAQQRISNLHFICLSEFLAISSTRCRGSRRLLVGIENGIIPQSDGTFVDQAAIILRLEEYSQSNAFKPQRSVEWSGWSESVPIPSNIMNELHRVKQQGLSYTVGDVVSQFHPNSLIDPQDFHSLYGPKSREQILTEALIKGIYQLWIQ